MDKCREAFEKLPEINAILRDSEFGFNESINQYYHPNHTEHRLNYAFLMGAWVAWQSRQAEIDEKDKRIDTLITQIEMSDFKDSLRHELKSNLAYLDLKALRGNDAT